MRVVNACFQKKGRNGTYRPAEKALWDYILGGGDCILAGDFDARSPVRNRFCTTRRNATFLEDLIAAHELQVLNDDRETRPTRPEGTLHSIIDLTLATPGAGPRCEGWRVVEEECVAHSDHVMIQWEWRVSTMKVDPRWRVRGWALKKKLDQEGEERAEGKKSGPTLGEVWQGRMSTVPLGEVGFGTRPILSEVSTEEELEDEIEWIQTTLIDILNEHTKTVTICARSKR